MVEILQISIQEGSGKKEIGAGVGRWASALAE
jgi:hypothetical protein